MDAILAVGRQLGLPLLVKAAAGGGGKGMRAVHRLEDLPGAVAAARREAAGAFGDSRVFLERLIARPRHVEVQVLGDRHGNVIHLLERECSIQRRHQKVLEESPSPGIDGEVRDALTAAAVTAARAIGYESAGTVEFVVDEDALAARRAGKDIAPGDTFAFLEVNTRLQVEHPVTEEVVRHRSPVTGELERIDLVREQLRVAAGLPLALRGEGLCVDGHAIEVRLYAEDAAADDRPSPGTVEAFTAGTGPGIRWEPGLEAGDAVPSQFDPMVGKVIAHGPSRAEAAARLAQALEETEILGVTTNRDLLIALLRDDAVLAGATTTGLLAERRAALLASVTPSDVEVERAVIAAAAHDLIARRRRGMLSTTVPAGFTNAATFPMVAGYNQEFAADDPEALVTAVLRVRRDGSHEAAVLRGIDPWQVDGDGPAAHATALDGAGWRRVQLSGGHDDSRSRGVGSGVVGSAVGGGGDAWGRVVGGGVAWGGVLRGGVVGGGVAGGGVSGGGVSGGGVGRPAAVDGSVVRGGAGVEGTGVGGTGVGGAAAGTVGQITIGDVRLGLRLTTTQGGLISVVLGGRRVVLRRVPRFPFRAQQRAPGSCVSPMPGGVVDVPVVVGQEVSAGQVLAVIEAMKTEHRLTAPNGGIVTEVAVAVGEQVAAGSLLVTVEATTPTDGQQAARDGA